MNTGTVLLLAVLGVVVYVFVAGKKETVAAGSAGTVGTPSSNAQGNKTDPGAIIAGVAGAVTAVATAVKSIFAQQDATPTTTQQTTTYTGPGGSGGWGV